MCVCVCVCVCVCSSIILSVASGSDFSMSSCTMCEFLSKDMSNAVSWIKMAAGSYFNLTMTGVCR